MAWLLDTNVLVYRFDPRDKAKQRRATELMREGLESQQARIPHQALLEFVAATTKPLSRDPGSALLSPDEAAREVEEMASQFPVLYPNESLFRLAIQGWGTYRLNWFDSHLWAFAEHYGLGVLYSEGFQSGRLYGSVRVINPFEDAQG